MIASTRRGTSGTVTGEEELNHQVLGGAGVLGGAAQSVYASGECEIDFARRELRVAGSPVPLGGRAFQIIEALAQSAGAIVTKDELMDRIWRGAIVSENTLAVHTMAVRKALGPYRNLLKTESGRGYRLLGEWTARDQGPRIAAPKQLRVSEATSEINIPVIATGLIGRFSAIERLRDLISAHRVVTLIGPGGIGKTALALEVASGLLGEFGGAARLVELASLSDPDLVPTAVASVLGLRFGGEEISVEAVARAVGGTNLLLLLDNCEHVIDAAAHLVEAMVGMCPRTTILVTSREILRASGEYVYRVPPLGVPAGDEEESGHILGHSAVELFIARLNALDSDFALPTEHLRTVAAICRHLDGIPLAIEFAAARAAILGVQQVAAGLHDRFTLLTRGRRTALPRHQTLRATLDWSYELLPEPEQRLLRRLAIFPAGFTLVAAAAIMTDTGLDAAAVTDGVVNLVGKSLVMQDQSESGGRWYLLETTRAYALEKLIEEREVDTAARQHAVYFRDFFSAARRDFLSRVPREQLLRHGREIDNVRAALDWSFASVPDVEIGIELTAAYAPVWMSLSLVAEGCERCERALQRLDADKSTTTRLRMQLQISFGLALLNTLGPSDRAQTHLTGALEASELLGDLHAQARALFALTGLQVYSGEYGRATITADRLRQVADQLGDPSIVAIAERRRCVNLLTLGRLPEAQQCFERFIEAAPQQAGLESGRLPGDRSTARALLARTLWLQGFIDRADSEVEASLNEAEGTGHQLTICWALYFGICRIAPMTGDFVTAESAIFRLTELATGLNSPFWMTAGRFLSGKLLVERGEFAAGLAVLREAFDSCSRTGWRMSYPEFGGSLALALAGIGRLNEAYDAVNNAIAAAGGHEDGQVWYVPELLRIKAEIILRQAADQSSLAEDCFEQATAMAREQGALTWELRIALSLARLRAAQGRQGEASRILSPVYARFKEGFDTTDLRTARAMLNVLPKPAR